MVKEDFANRRNSFNAGKVQPKIESKSTSANKNYLGSSSLNNRSQGNGNMGPPPALLNQKSHLNNQPNKRGIGMDAP